MKRLFGLFLSVIGVGTSCAQPDSLSKSGFAAMCADSLRRADPRLDVVVAGDLHLKIIVPGGKEADSFLDNFYGLYKQDPKGVDGLVQRFIRSNMETIRSMDDPPDRASIVPMVKDRAWLAEVSEGSLTRTGEDPPRPVHEDLNEELVIVYAQNTKENLRYMPHKELEAIGIERSELRQLACENLERLLPKVERHGDGSVYMLTAGGDFEASLLLLDRIWDDVGPGIEGDPVVAIPTRDLLFVTGSGDPAGIARVRALVENAFTQGSYHLTRKLFIRRDGRFVLYEE